MQFPPPVFINGGNDGHSQSNLISLDDIFDEMRMGFDPDRLDQGDDTDDNSDEGDGGSRKRSLLRSMTDEQKVERRFNKNETTIGVTFAITQGKKS